MGRRVDFPKLHTVPFTIILNLPTEDVLNTQQLGYLELQAVKHYPVFKTLVLLMHDRYDR